jgi:hypothetical protein
MERAMGIEPTFEAWEATQNTEKRSNWRLFDVFGFLKWIPIGAAETTISADVAEHLTCGYKYLSTVSGHPPPSLIYPS